MVKFPNRLEDLYPATAVEKILEALQQPDISGKVRDTLHKVGLGEINPLEQVQQAWQQARSWLESLAQGQGAHPDESQINATGRLLTGEFASLPIGTAVAQIYAKHATRFQSIAYGSKKVSQTLQHELGLSGCMSCSVASALQQLIGNKKTLVAKTDLVRLPLVGNVARILASLNVEEIGPANGCTADDWSSALLETDPSSTCILLVSPNTLDQESAQQQLRHAVEAGAKHEVPVYWLMADAVANEQLAEQTGMPLLSAENTEGCQAVVVPLNLFLGGPEGALTLGSPECISQLQHRLDESGTALNASLSAAACVAIQLQQLQNDLGTGLLPLLLANPENLRERAQRIAIQLHDNGLVRKAEVVQRNTPLGAAPWNRYQLSNWAISIESDRSPETLARQLRKGQADSDRELIPAIHCDLQDNRLLLDLRFVEPQDDHLLVLALTPMVSGSQIQVGDSDKDASSDKDQSSTDQSD